MGFYIVQLLTGLSSAASLFLVASGLSIIFGVTRIVNLSHGSFYMLGAYIAYSLITRMGGGVFGFWGGVLLAAILVGLIGAVVELTVMRRVYRAPELFQLVATFGVILIIQDLALLVWGPEDLLGPRAPGLEGAIDIMGTALPLYDLVLIALGPVVLIGLWLLFNRTRWGVLVRAATEDREMLGALGVNQAWLFTATFILGSALAGLGGAAQLPKGGADLLMDFGILAAVFVVVVIGGMGSILGAYLAAVLISELNTFGILFLPKSTLVLMFAVMAIVLVVRPWGLLGRPERPGQLGEVGELELPYKPASARLRGLFAALIIGLALVPVVAPAYTVLTIDLMIFALLATSLHFLLGPSGLVSFGHAAYFGLGAYGVAMAVHYFKAPMELAIFLAPLIAGLFALSVGWFLVRLTGVYFAMLTLAVAQILWSIAVQWTGLTGGDDGMLGVWPSSWASEPKIYFYLVMVLCVGGIIVLRHSIFSHFGTTARACRDSATRTEAIGINVSRHQWLAFSWAAIFAGLAGGLHAFAKGSVFPDTLDLALSFEALIMVFLGGVKTLSGPFIGSSAFAWLNDQFSNWQVIKDYWRSLLGLVIIILVIAFPQGIAGALRRSFGRIFHVETEAH